MQTTNRSFTSVSLLSAILLIRKQTRNEISFTKFETKFLTWKKTDIWNIAATLPLSTCLRCTANIRYSSKFFHFYFTHQLTDIRIRISWKCHKREHLKLISWTNTMMLSKRPLWHWWRTSRADHGETWANLHAVHPDLADTSTPQTGTADCPATTYYNDNIMPFVISTTNNCAI